jgi:hypothetical protein
MIRGLQIQDLHRAGLHYISAISKPQIETMLASCTLQMKLFDNHLAEILVPAQEDSGLPAEHYILRRNPVRQAEIQASRSDRLAALQREVTRLNIYLEPVPKRRFFETPFGWNCN